jgi:small redox-active disulfide protein 2
VVASLGPVLPGSITTIYVIEGAEPMKLEIFGTGCPKCTKLYEHAVTAVRELGREAEVVKVEDINAIMQAGVMLTPALGIDGNIVSSGKAMDVEEIKKHISP